MRILGLETVAVAGTGANANAPRLLPAGAIGRACDEVDVLCRLALHIGVDAAVAHVRGASLTEAHEAFRQRAARMRDHADGAAYTFLRGALSTKKKIQAETIESNKKVWQRYSEALIGAAFAQKLLEVEGPIDFSFDMSALQDPIKESERIQDRMVATHTQNSSSLSQTMHGEELRREKAPDSVLGMNTTEMERALQAVRDRIERDYERNHATVPRVKCLAMLKVPEHVKRMLRPEYE